MNHAISRRRFLQQSLVSGSLGAFAIGAGMSPWINAQNIQEDDRPKLPVAGIATVYTRNSHADVILGKILEGYRQQGGPGPALKLASLYVDQFPGGDLSRKLAKKHGVPIFNTIEEAVTVGGSDIPVAGVLCIGEHGDYPYTPDTHQHQYPRRRFFDDVAATFQKHGKVTPLFNDKHLAYNWRDAKHIYDTARRMKIPFLAGSSIPTAWRKPPLALPLGCEIEEVIALGYGGPESYGFHTLEGLQCMVERRKGGETGVASVQAVTGDDVWKAEREGRWSRKLLQAGLAAQPSAKQGRLEDNLSENAPFYLIEYRDGLKATVAMLGGVGREFGFVAKLKGKTEPVACRFALEEDAPYGHFAWLLKAIEHTVHTGKPAYPVERTLLTTGVLDRAMHSLAQQGKRLRSPELTVKYAPADWPFADTEVGVPPS